ncbi:winged helix-turn-helix transcriptional regulator [Streptomyces sp. NPDC017082]|uniref:winged helix-turn-helix transcriptional regulator n=1 Tax=Streptomyces sp. NPDC017082 TaxID=3364974 RepID=UPI0037BCA08E
MDKQACPARLVLSRIGERWTMPACLHIGHGVTRFGDLRAALPGVSAKVLSETLTRLERDGLIRRKVIDSRPPSAEYHLTPLGESLLQTLRVVVDWAVEYAPLIEEARRSYDDRNSLQLSATRDC